MTTADQIKVLCLRKNISVSELARKLNQTPQNFSAKLKRDSLTPLEVKNICLTLNVTHEHYFVLEDGEIIKWIN